MVLRQPGRFAVGAISPKLPVHRVFLSNWLQQDLKQIFQEKGLPIGPVQIHPFLGFAEVFTDNAFRTNTARESDFITVIAPGIQAQLPFGEQHKFVAHYNASRLWFVRFPSNDALVQDAWGRLVLEFSGKTEGRLTGWI